MVSVALLSNPKSTGNRALLPKVRSYCARHPDIFHYEVEHVDQIADAMRSIACVNPRVLVINGGDGTVQAALTELHVGGHFNGAPPPVAVLPNGKTNLIALDLGAHGDPLAALDRVVEIAKADMAPHIVLRELIALSNGEEDDRPVLGMFLGGAGLADAMLYCRNKIYPLGLPNGISHVIAFLAVLVSLVFGSAGFLPPRPRPISVSLIREGQISGRFTLLIVTTLERMLFGSRTETGDDGRLKLMAVDQSPMALLRAAYASLLGRLGRGLLTGVHVERGDVIRIDGDRSSVILDGELFEARVGQPIVLRTTQPVSFVKLAA
ncbi:diacylglycerol/lipid kinase family protein [Sphingomonas flavalba]|uniref:diacylglycerol/lipid kinase family protein n=1 Tax=Sphingomonas flavalba TaxID=2559804 RepID=UPI0039E111FE